MNPGEFAFGVHVMLFPRSLALAAALATASTFPVPAQAGDHGDAVFAGVAGFAIGTLFGNATARPRYYSGPVYYSAPPPVVYEPVPVYYAPAPWTPEWYAYCARKYDSFHAPSGTFLGYDGFRHTCI
jgi:hypothetical protein